jgi:hypothetical protein
VWHYFNRSDDNDRRAGDDDHIFTHPQHSSDVDIDHRPG